MSTTTSSSSSSHYHHPRLTTLKHLQEYCQQHDSGNIALKQSLWQLTKSRHNSRTLVLESPFQADQLREELQARTRLLLTTTTTTNTTNDNDNDEPSLISENKTTNEIQKNPMTPSSSTPPPSFQLVDILEFKSRNKENEKNLSSSSQTTTATTATGKLGDVTNANNAATATTTTGLRQRKNKKTVDLSASTSDWTIVEEETNNENETNNNDNSNDNDDDNDDKKIHYRDPLELFGGGLTPRELKMAQQKAKIALQSYIQAANQVSAIMEILKHSKEEA